MRNDKASRGSSLAACLRNSIFNIGVTDYKNGVWNGDVVFQSDSDEKKNRNAMYMYELGRYWVASGGPLPGLGPSQRRATKDAMNHWYHNADDIWVPNVRHLGSGF